MLAGCVVLTARLFHLQVAQGEAFRQQADALMLRAPLGLPPVRGRILDRQGALLASDEPSVNLCVHYGALSLSGRYLDAAARRMRRDPPFADRSVAEVRDELVRRLRGAWSELSDICDVPLSEIADRRDRVCRRVDAIREHVWKAQQAAGIDGPLKSVRIAEEAAFHPILLDLTPEQRTRIELRLSGLPFMRLEPAVRRATAAPISMMHLLGRLGQVSPEQIAADPDAENERRRYQPGERAGVGGVERLAESTLRGTRGEEVRDLDGNLVEQDEPVDGRDVRLTIDAVLQQTLYELLGRAVAAHPPSTGAACAILSLPRREVLALVSYPSYDARTFTDDFDSLRDDTRRRPLWPRALAIEYPPGSIIKPASLLIGLASGRVRPETTVECRGKLFANSDAWRCWTVWRDMPPHGVLDGAGAIQHSCNIFFYTLGQNLGAARLTQGLRELIYGPGATGPDARWPGLGLIEEAGGLIPSPERLKREFRPADGRNYAIGQGELQITPLQAAMLMATVACGNFLPPSILENDAARVPQTFAGIQSDYWRIVRGGLYHCVNSPGGTAYPGGKVGAVAVCGKTGSAQSVPRIATRRFVFETAPGRRREAVAPTIEAARERLDLPADAKPIEQKPVQFWPPPETGKTSTATHAWFAGYAPRDDPKIAMAVVIEYAGSGGKVAAPVGRRIFHALLRNPRGYLLPDGGYQGPADFPDEDADSSSGATPPPTETE